MELSISFTRECESAFAAMRAYSLVHRSFTLSNRLSKQQISPVLKVVMDDYDLVTCAVRLELIRNFVFQVFNRENSLVLIIDNG